MILDYEDTTGRLYLDDFEETRQRLNDAYAHLPGGVGKEVTEADMIAVGRRMPISHLARFAFIGLRYASRITGQPFTGTLDDVVGWLMAEPHKLAVVVQYFIESLPKPSETDDAPAPADAKKKKAAASTLTAS